jgi:hypothetical protein
VPTYTRLPRFLKDYRALGDAEKALVKDALAKFIADLETGAFRKGLRVKGVQGAPGIFDMTWSDDGRATFQYGPPVEEHRDEPHIIWRRIGSHDIFGNP